MKHKPQLRHHSKTAPRPYDPMIGREKSSVVNNEVMEFRQPEPVENVESEVLDRRMRVSRNVEEHELENALRSLPQHGSRMNELLLQLFNLEDPETAAPRTTDRWILLPRYWIRMHHEWRDCYFDPDDAPSPVDGKLSDHLYGDRYTMFFDSSDPSKIDTGHQNDWSDIEMLTAQSGSVMIQVLRLVINGLDIHCSFPSIDRLLVRMQSSRLMTRVPSSREC